MSCFVVCDGNISEPDKSLGSGARRCAYSKGPRFSGLVALDVPIWPGLTVRCVFPSRRNASNSWTVVESQKGVSGLLDQREHVFRHKAQQWTSRSVPSRTRRGRRRGFCANGRIAGLTRRGCVGEDERIDLLGKGSHDVCVLVRRRRDAVNIDKIE